MIEQLKTVLNRLLVTGTGDLALPGIDPGAQFRPEENDRYSAARNINAAFLITLSDAPPEVTARAGEYIERMESDPEGATLIEFYRYCIKVINTELRDRCGADAGFRGKLEKLQDHCAKATSPEDRDRFQELLYDAFFPEGTFIFRDRDREVQKLREKRRVNISSLNPDPVKEPAREILFTANALLTVPGDGAGTGDLPVSREIRDELEKIMGEEQRYWYDHPVPVGTSPDTNEVIYGLEHLDGALEQEVREGLMGGDETVDCAVSVTVTHDGLHRIAKQYIDEELAGHGDIRRLRVHIFTESDTERIIGEVLMPAARTYLGMNDDSPLKAVFGVDGRYGRHYSFLKAIAPFWNVFISEQTRATFKIDLDQVFPQEALKRETGRTAFGHFMSPLWGARGADAEGNPVHLGFLAGALVNEKDFSRSLFTPDVTFPDEDPAGDETVFHSRLPQALSTEAEMMCRYGEGGIDGERSCIQRIHVTGGTNGILVEALRRYRPFAPTFIGRAEDQSYLLSVLYGEKDGAFLRYVHRDGLIMRHDKEAFAGEAIKAAKIGKLIGDYVRILLFSFYVESLPWPVKRIKEAVDPFTGCFISLVPVTVVFLRYCLKTARFFEEGSHEEGREFALEGAERIREVLEEKEKNSSFIREMYESEKRGWDMYYDILDAVEEKIREGDRFALETAERAREIVSGCRLSLQTAGGKE